MKKIFVFSLLSCTFLAACHTTKPTRPAPKPLYGYTGEPSAATEGTQPASVDVAPIQVEPTPAPAPKPTPAATPIPQKREAVYGIPVPGKLGFMKSPFNPDAGLIDYRGLAPGTEVKDPYTAGKIILVP